MNQTIEISCINNLSKENIDVSSKEYQLEYPLDNRVENEYHYLIPPLLLYKNSMYKPVFGVSVLNSYIKIYGRVKLALCINRFSNDYELYRFLLFLKKNYLGINPVEKSLFLNRFKSIVGDSIYKDLEISKNVKSIKGYEKLLISSKKIKRDLITGQINEINLFEIFHLFEDKFWNLVEDFIIKLKIGTKKRIEVINMLYEITQRDNVSIESIINSDEVNRVLKQKLDVPQKGERIYWILYEKRYPEITIYKNKFYNYFKSLKIDKNIHFEIPQNFEKWEFGINFNFRNLEELKSKLNELQMIIKNQDFEKLLRMRF